MKIEEGRLSHKDASVPLSEGQDAPFVSLPETQDAPEEYVRYVGHERIIRQRHDGGLRPAIGSVCRKVLRANRSAPLPGDTGGWTYNHQPYLAWWKGRYLLHYLSSPVAEHEAESRTMLMTSPDGVAWSEPVVLFPPLVLPDGKTSVMHQRMGFYTSTSDRLLALGFYGTPCPSPWPDKWDMPNDGQGLGRVVREIQTDGRFGPIHVIRRNLHAPWREEELPFPRYDQSEDGGFVSACAELLADKLMTQQWWEEDRSEDGFYTQSGGKAFCWYHRADGKTVGLWKWSKVALSGDEGRSWGPMLDMPTLVMAGAKVWGQRMTDGRYALVYNPTRDNGYRWPLAIATGADGQTFDRMACVHGRVSPRKYSGFCKDWGPQYVRGIEEGNGTPPDGAVWLTYSMNKEDLWVTRVPVPVRTEASGPVQDDFEAPRPEEALRDWNLYTGPWASAGVETENGADGNRCLVLRDRDPYEDAEAIRIFETADVIRIRFRIKAGQMQDGMLEMRVLNACGDTAALLGVDHHGLLHVNKGADRRVCSRLVSSHWMMVEWRIDCRKGTHHLTLDDAVLADNLPLMTDMADVERISFRTGFDLGQPSLESTNHMFLPDLPHAGLTVTEAVFLLDDLLITGEAMG